MSIPSEIRQEVLSPGDRRYTLALPCTHAPGQRLSLVLALHYAGHGAPFYGRGMVEGLVEPALRGLGAIVAGPDCTGPDWTHPHSEGDLLDLLDHLQASHSLDPQRTLLTGYSMGGHGAWHLAARHPDRFRAAVVMAGWPPTAALLDRWRIPLYVIHSRDDEVVPLGPTERSARQLHVRGATVQMVTLEGISHFETHRFVPHLTAAVPWIEQIWADADRMPDKEEGSAC